MTIVFRETKILAAHLCQKTGRKEVKKESCFQKEQESQQSILVTISQTFTKLCRSPINPNHQKHVCYIMKVW